MSNCEYLLAGEEEELNFNRQGTQQESSPL